MNLRRIVLLLLMSSLISCTNKPIKLIDSFQLSERQHLYDISEWSLEGRLAVADKNNSMSASVVWTHREEFEKIELTGPFGQGRTVVVISKKSVDVDQGDSRQRYYGDVDDLLERHLGISVPISALKFWVFGLVQPKIDFIDFANGFKQLQWDIEYQQMQLVGQHELPRKIKIHKDLSKLKLIISRWQIN